MPAFAQQKASATEIIETIIEVGKVPYIFTEGKNNTRLRFLAEVPKGKVFYHFETACGLDYCSHENVEAMFDTVRNYGKH